MKKKINHNSNYTSLYLLCNFENLSTILIYPFYNNIFQFLILVMF